MTYKQVDTYSLKEKCKQTLEQYSSVIVKKWDDFFSNHHEKLKKDLIQCIFDYMGKIQASSFDSNTFTNVITEAISNLQPMSILNLKETTSKYIALSDDIAYRRFTMSDYETEDYKKSELPNRITELFSNYEKSQLNAIRTTNSAYESDIQDEINKKMNSVDEQIEQMRKNFGKILNSALNKYVSKLEVDIEKKENTLSTLSKTLKKLKELKKILKK